MIKFSGRSEKEEKSKDASMWTFLHSVSTDLKERENELKAQNDRIEQKRLKLKQKGIFLDTGHIEKAEEEPQIENEEEDSLETLIQRMDRKMQREEEYLDALERALDEALAPAANSSEG